MSTLSPNLNTKLSVRQNLFKITTKMSQWLVNLNETSGIRAALVGTVSGVIRPFVRVIATTFPIIGSASNNGRAVLSVGNESVVVVILRIDSVFDAG